MKYVIAFSSRTNAVKFYDSLRSFGTTAALINTPSSIKKGCGLSVKTDDIAAAKKVLSYGQYNSFYGIYETGSY